MHFSLHPSLKYNFSWISFFCCSFYKFLEYLYTYITFIVKQQQQHWFHPKEVLFLPNLSIKSLYIRIMCFVLAELLDVRHQVWSIFLSPKCLIGCFTYNKPLDSYILVKHSSSNFLNNSTHKCSQIQAFPFPCFFQIKTKYIIWKLNLELLKSCNIRQNQIINSFLKILIFLILSLFQWL